MLDDSKSILIFQKSIFLIFFFFWKTFFEKVFLQIFDTEPGENVIQRFTSPFTSWLKYLGNILYLGSCVLLCIFDETCYFNQESFWIENRFESRIVLNRKKYFLIEKNRFWIENRLIWKNRKKSESWPQESESNRIVR